MTARHAFACGALGGLAAIALVVTAIAAAGVLYDHVERRIEQQLGRKEEDTR